MYYPLPYYTRFAQVFGYNSFVVKSWWEHKRFSSIQEAKIFFEENQEIIKAKPFIKWVGGKRQLIAQFQDLFPTDFNNYHEPFLGGGAVFFNLQKKQSYLSDLNGDLINLYQVIQKHPKKLIAFLESEEISKDRFLEMRLWDREDNYEKKYSNIERAGRFMYLNRLGFNGLYRVNSKGQFNVPYGAHNNPDIVQRDNILAASKLLNETGAIIKHQSFEKVVEQSEKDDFVYLDPPYDVLSETSNFTSYIKEDCGTDLQYNLAQVCKDLDKKGVNFMMSNHDTPLIRELYKDFTIHIVKAKRSVNSKGTGRGKVDEVVVINY
ncbi:DNA adenine methylase [Candidatus Gracilibacteria bacterium]|nr:DNA adenine methylase [Candidatus Gracilibacteria bacterium]